jgi:hypothetical protein
MKYLEYIHLSTRTEPPYAPIRKRLANELDVMDVTKDHFNQPDLVRGLHAAMGMHTEAGELAESWQTADMRVRNLDLVHFMEEIGDICWYEGVLGAMFPCFHTTDFDSLIQSGSLRIEKRRKAVTNLIFDITKYSGRIADQFKRAIFYGTELDDNYIFNQRISLLEALRHLAELVGSDMAHVRQINIDKLKKRFPEGFTETDAVTRDLDAERTELEGGK